MILDSKETTIAYRCPICGAGVVSVVGVFSLSGDMLKLKCSCGKSEMTMEYTRDRKLRLTVPCIVCPHPHNYTVSSNLFFGEEVFHLGCPYTGLDTCFIGSKDGVLEALKESGEMLEGMLEEAGVDNLDMLRQNEGASNASFDDPQIEEIIRFVLADLSDEGKIHCHCKDGEVPDYKFEFVPPDYENAKIYCEACGCSKEIPMTSLSQANSFLECDELDLE